MKRLLLLLALIPASALAGWSADWTALEAHVDNATNAPPVFITTNLIHDLQQARLERANVLAASAVPDNAVDTTAPAFTRFTIPDVLKDIDDFIAAQLGYFSATNLHDGAGNLTPMGEWNWADWENLGGTSAKEFIACGSSTNYTSVTLPTWNEPDDSLHLIAAAAWHDNFQTNMANTAGFPGPIGQWIYQSATASHQPVNLYMPLARKAWPGGLLAESVYTITNQYTSGGTNHYQAGWVSTYYDELHALFRTNDWTGAESLVKINIICPTGTLPSTEFTLTGTSIHTGNWYKTSNWIPLAKADDYHVQATTNTLTITGTNTHTIATVPWMELTGLTATNTVDATNIAQIAYLGSAITVAWAGTRPSYAEPGTWPDSGALTDRHAMVWQAPRFITPHTLVARKRILQSMQLTPAVVYGIDTNVIDYSSGSYVGSYATATSNWAAVSTNNTFASLGNLSLRSFIQGQQACNISPNPGYRVQGEQRGVYCALSNLPTQVAIDTAWIYGADDTGETVDTDQYLTGVNYGLEPYPLYQSNLPNHVRTNIFIAASTTNHTAGTPVEYQFTPFLPTWPPAPGQAGDPAYHSSLDGWVTRTFRGHFSRILTYALVDWDFEYE